MWRNIDLDLLRTFLAISKSGSFSAAAVQIGRTQAAVSLQIKKLEDILGKPVFERNNRNVRLSTAGEILHEYAEKMIGLNDEAWLRVSENDIAGILRLGAPEALTSTHLPQILALFRKNHPDIMLDVSCKLTDDLLDDFARDEYDVVIFKREQKTRKTGTLLFKEPLVWACSKKAEPDPDKVLPLILSPHPCMYRRRSIECLEKSRVRWHTVMTLHSLYGRISAVKAGLGISLLPLDIIDDELKIIKNKDLITDPGMLELAFQRRDSIDNNLSQRFIEHLIHYFETV